MGTRLPRWLETPKSFAAEASCKFSSETKLSWMQLLQQLQSQLLPTAAAAAAAAAVRAGLLPSGLLRLYLLKFLPGRYFCWPAWRATWESWNEAWTGLLLQSQESSMDRLHLLTQRFYFWTLACILQPFLDPVAWVATETFKSKQTINNIEKS